jgi:hypothetical protein
MSPGRDIVMATSLACRSEYKGSAAIDFVRCFSTKDPVKSLDNLGHRINTVTEDP